jgi:DNA-binding transcriptional regulator YbjK
VTEQADTSGSDLLPPPWTRAPQRAPKRRRDPLTQEKIVDAALEVLDTDGLDLLSMRHVARTLHTYFAEDDADQRFELLLDLFVDGLAQRAHS